MDLIDCLLIHTPKHAHNSVPFGECLSIMLMPMGLLSLADHLERYGITTRILHMGLESTDIEHNFSIIDYLNKHQVKTVGLSLHWHQQSFDVIKIAQEIKKAIPDIFVFIGGITASYFAYEILNTFTAVDAVIRGDAYTCIVDLCKSVLVNRNNLREIPNIIFRKYNGDIIGSQFKYVISEKQFNELPFPNIKLLKNWERYLKIPWVWICNKTQQENEEIPLRFPLSIGLGCNLGCIYCGGCGNAQKEIFCRNKCLYRSTNSIVKAISDASIYGIDRFHICYNPAGKHDDAYYTELFSKIKALHRVLDVSFECWGLPSRNLIDYFSRTFHSSSIITISPETGVESIRSICKGFFYTNQDLIQCLEYMQTKRVNTTIFFTSGLPCESLGDIRATSLFQRQLLKQFPSINILSMPIELEPGSPMYVEPQKYGVIKHRKTFVDFYQAHKNSQVSLGYSTNYLTEAEILSYSSSLLVNCTLI